MSKAQINYHIEVYTKGGRCYELDSMKRETIIDYFWKYRRSGKEAVLEYEYVKGGYEESATKAVKYPMTRESLLSFMKYYFK
jgi:DNA primase catalytic subunit